MKMVKSLLLGSAAGLIAVAGAQAADLPVKAKAVEYVKICSLYGVGYYYIPGTDTCIKIGGYVRYEAYHNEAGGLYAEGTPQGAFTRHGATLAMQARFRLTGDVRTQTEYGTLRSYFAFGVNALNNAGGALEVGGPTLAIALERAFIQFAGFTIGRSDTFFAFYNGAAYGLVPFGFDGSSGPSGLNVVAYTWQFGNGLSATLSLEDQMAHSAPVIDLGRANAVTSTAGVMGAGLFAQPGLPFHDNKGGWVPDIVGNLRVDQAWGSAQLMGALHAVGGRYNFNQNNGADGTTCGQPGATNNNTTLCGHPADKWGWAVGAGMTLKMPWDAKDTLSGQIAYAEGASRYVAFTYTNRMLHREEGFAMGSFTDAVYGGVGLQDGGTVSDVQLTKTFGGTLAFEHYWTPSLRTSWVAGYLEVEYSDAAKVQIANLGRRCALGGSAATSFRLRPAVNNGTINCDPDWSMYRLASRTMWNPVANLDIGIEIAYTHINTAFEGAGHIQPGAGNPNGTGFSQGTYGIHDESYWSGAIRVQRSFWP
jgi:hypothetical protein